MTTVTYGIATSCRMNGNRAAGSANDLNPYCSLANRRPSKLISPPTLPYSHLYIHEPTPPTRPNTTLPTPRPLISSSLHYISPSTSHLNEHNQNGA